MGMVVKIIIQVLGDNPGIVIGMVLWLITKKALLLVWYHTTIPYHRTVVLLSIFGFIL